MTKREILESYGKVELIGMVAPGTFRYALYSSSNTPVLSSTCNSEREALNSLYKHINGAVWGTCEFIRKMDGL